MKISSFPDCFATPHLNCVTLAPSIVSGLVHYRMLWQVSHHESSTTDA